LATKEWAERPGSDGQKFCRTCWKRRRRCFGFREEAAIDGLRRPVETLDRLERRRGPEVKELRVEIRRWWRDVGSFDRLRRRPRSKRYKTFYFFASLPKCDQLGSHQIFKT
jgi:hypothetical protein